MLYLIIRLVLTPLARFVYRPKIVGAHNVPRRGAVIFASNHLSFIDSVVIAMTAPRRVVFLAKSEYFQRRGLVKRIRRLFFVGIGSIPVERGTHHDAHASLVTARRVLSEGKAFAIYPEGTRSRDGRLYRGRTGVGWLALTTKAPVVPVALTGTERLQPVGRRLPRIHRVTVRFGPPLRFTNREHTRPAQARRAITDEIMHEIADLSGQERSPDYNEPPSAA